MNNPEAQAVRHALEYYAAAFGALALTPEVIERAAQAATPAPAPAAPLRDAQEQPFEDWWEREGQFCRAGGGAYEKTFAWNAWCAALAATPAPALAQAQQADLLRLFTSYGNAMYRNDPEAAEQIAQRFSAALAATPAPADRVPMPTNADQAAAMALLGEAWLRENAPERLRAATPAPASDTICTCPSGDGSLRWPCPAHPPEASAVKESLTAQAAAKATGLDNQELQDAIMYAHSAVKTAAPTSPVFSSLIDHFKALMAEQRKRASAVGTKP